MAASPPVDYAAIGHKGERMVEAHRYFSEAARDWLTRCGAEQAESRAAAVERVTRDLLQMVVIDLAAEENAQEIFETLNARGAQLTAADLIKNFVFQRLLESGADVEQAYEKYWKEFETAFWEAGVSLGRIRYPRSSIFLNHWLVSRTGEEVVAREVFSRFKTYADFDARRPMIDLLQQIDRGSHVYRRLIEGSEISGSAIDRLGLFGYRTGVLESEVIKPLVLYLFDAEELPVPDEQVVKALDVVESWMVRRMLVRATTKNYNKVVAELINALRLTSRATAGDAIESFFQDQESVSSYWPDDEEVRAELGTLLAYRLLGRGRLRMVLEAVEDHLRGWRAGRVGLGGERVSRGKLHIEHVMPRKWAMHWPLDTPGTESLRDRLIHTVGNLTLLTGPLNGKVSNGPWSGPDGKRAGIESHDVLLINRELLKTAKVTWSDVDIRARSDQLARLIIEVWPVPENHRSGFGHQEPAPRYFVQVSDLIAAGVLEAGQQLFPRKRKFADLVATLLPDGRIDLGGAIHASPSDAARAITGETTNGWWFFLVQKKPRRALRDVRREYRESISSEIGDAEGEEDEDDDEEG
jgi:hypothetical protein